MHTIQQICELFLVGRKTVQSWIDAGQLVAIDVSPVGSKRTTYRVSQESLEKFQAVRSSQKSPPMGSQSGKKLQPVQEIIK